MVRVRFPALLALLMVSGAAFAQSPSGEGNFLTNLLGMRSTTAASAPMAITTTPVDIRANVKSQAPKPPVDARHDSKHESRPAKVATKVAPTGEPSPTARIEQSIDPRPVAAEDGDPDRPAKRVGKLPPFRGAGSQAVCVRTCDGYFFPVNYEGAHSNDRYEEACQLACPAAKTEVYFMPRGADIKVASTQTGQRYTALDTAFLYRKERNPSCGCKAENQSWGEVLTQADSLIKQNKNDIIVTPERSMELARPAEPAADKPVAEVAAPKKTVATSKKAGKTGTEGKTATAPSTPRLTTAPAPKPPQSAAWRNAGKFQRIDPEPTASIRTDDD